MRLSIIEKILFCLLGSLWLVLSVNWIGDILIPTSPVQASAAKVSAPAPETTAPEKAGEKTAEAPAQQETKPAEGVMAMLATADAAAGKKVFKKCKACHSTEKGGKNKVGPNLWNVVGQAKGGVPGYNFSGAISGLGGTWTYKDLDGFLTNPRSFARGTKMGFRGLKKEKDRAAIIVYLRSLSDQPKPLP